MQIIGLFSGWFQKTASTMHAFLQFSQLMHLVGSNFIPLPFFIVIASVGHTLAHGALMHA
jgi:hypothetical protein